jgi:hypothetical protein
MKILIYLLLTFNAVGLDFQFITKIPSIELLSSEQHQKKDLNNFLISHIRKDGCFIAGNFWQKQVVVTDTGKYICFDSQNISTIISTNIVSIIQNSAGEITFTIDVFNRQAITNNNGISILKTISNSGYISESKIMIGEYTVRYTVNNSGTKSENLNSTNYSFNIFTKFDSQWKPVSSTKMYGKTSTGENNPSAYGTKIDVSNKQIITFELKDDYINFYRLTDSDLLSSPNRITLGSSQNGSLTATVNNPEQALLNIQSSTNLIDWNTFKTIQNEPSLEVVIPANKPKDFIRAIE